MAKTQDEIIVYESPNQVNRPFIIGRKFSSAKGEVVLRVPVEIFTHKQGAIENSEDLFHVSMKDRDIFSIAVSATKPRPAKISFDQAESVDLKSLQTGERKWSQVASIRGDDIQRVHTKVNSYFRQNMLLLYPQYEAFIKMSEALMVSGKVATSLWAMPYTAPLTPQREVSLDLTQEELRRRLIQAEMDKGRTLEEAIAHVGFGPDISIEQAGKDGFHTKYVRKGPQAYPFIEDTKPSGCDFPQQPGVDAHLKNLADQKTPINLSVKELDEPTPASIIGDVAQPRPIEDLSPKTGTSENGDGREPNFIELSREENSDQGISRQDEPDIEKTSKTKAQSERQSVVDVSLENAVKVFGLPPEIAEIFTNPANKRVKPIESLREVFSLVTSPEKLEKYISDPANIPLKGLEEYIHPWIIKALSTPESQAPSHIKPIRTLKEAIKLLDAPENLNHYDVYAQSKELRNLTLQTLSIIARDLGNKKNENENDVLSGVKSAWQNFSMIYMENMGRKRLPPELKKSDGSPVWDFR